MNSNFEKFAHLHGSPELFVLPNVWNAKSAIIFQERNFPAIATSSAAVASSLGHEDGQGMPFHEYLFVIRRILSSVDIPLSVDMEMGYGTSDEEIYANVRGLIDLGVVGINLEDSIIDDRGRVLKASGVFAKTIEYIASKLASDHLDIFVNVRCDTYILDVADKELETRIRLKAYESAGANGVFLPCICSKEDISDAVAHTTLPINVMCIPGLPGFDILKDLGVKRISMGPVMFNKVYGHLDEIAQTLYKS